MTESRWVPVVSLVVIVALWAALVALAIWAARDDEGDA